MSQTLIDAEMVGVGVTPDVHRNDIINGGYLVNQENDTAAADDDYSIGDLFLHVGEAAVTTSLQTSGGPQGDRKFARINIDTANKQSGWVYFLSNADCQDYIANGKMSFGIKIKTTSAAIDTVRIGLLKWTGTADAVTSDVVNSWAQDGNNPGLATSWSYENVPADVNLTTSWVRHTVEDVTVDSDTNNLACLVWIDDGTVAEDDQLDVTEWQLNPGSTVNDFSSPKLTDVLMQVYYYFQKFVYDQVSSESICHGGVQNGQAVQGTIDYRRTLRVNPTITFTAANTYTGGDGATGTVGTSVATVRTGPNSLRFNVAGSGWTIHRAGEIMRSGTSTTSIQADARL